MPRGGLCGGFMQLNPARGWKQVRKEVVMGFFDRLVYAAQPREGTETSTQPTRGKNQQHHGLCSSTPRGDGNKKLCTPLPNRAYQGLCSSTPRGDGNRDVAVNHALNSFIGLCSSTPRGDGNNCSATACLTDLASRGLCSSTPRGDGNLIF